MHFPSVKFPGLKRCECKKMTNIRYGYRYKDNGNIHSDPSIKSYIGQLRNLLYLSQNDIDYFDQFNSIVPAMGNSNKKLVRFITCKLKDSELADLSWKQQCFTLQTGRLPDLSIFTSRLPPWSWSPSQATFHRALHCTSNGEKNFSRCPI